MIILAFIYYNARNRLEKVFKGHRVFLALVQTNIILIISDIGAWVFDGLPGYYYLLLNKVFNLMLFVVEPITGTLWILYICYQVKHSEKQVKGLVYVLSALFIVNGLIKQHRNQVIFSNTN